MSESEKEDHEGQEAESAANGMESSPTRLRRRESVPLEVANSESLHPWRVHLPKHRLSRSHPTILALTYRTADALVDWYLKKPGLSA
jgi:hypothetical protein